MNIVVADQAQDDLIEGFHFYERQASGLGEVFLASIMSDIDSLINYAGIHPLQWGKHKMLCKRFPFSVYYTISQESIQVVAVLDQRRDPAWNRKRVE